MIEQGLGKTASWNEFRERSLLGWLAQKADRVTEEGCVIDLNLTH
jgi:hypothetical protein